MIGRLDLILRHPIKSIGFEEIGRTSLAPGHPLALDRRWAVAHEAARFSGQPDGWQPKVNFLRGVAAPELMAISARSDGDVLHLSHPCAAMLSVDPSRADDQARLIEWLRPLWPAELPAPTHLVEVPGHALTDKPYPWLSLLSQSTLRDLEARLDRPVSPHRFRGNLWVDGWPALAERDLVGRRFRVGTVVLEGTQPITRCRATCANPETGAEDLDMLAALSDAYGHKDFGIYASVIEPGEITRGDVVELV